MSNADQSKLAALIQSLMDEGSISAGVKIVTGTYTGDGETNREIILGVKPKAVVLKNRENGSDYFALFGQNCPAYASDDKTVAASITDRGFSVLQHSYTPYSSHLNSDGYVYNYIAFV